MKSKVRVDAPSNIALIKYMGKSSTKDNVPSNPSLSWTLNHLWTSVEIEEKSSGSDEWQVLTDQNLYPLQLSPEGQKRFLAHLNLVKERLGYSGSFIVRSANNFPMDCGLASSASSFAALTKAAVHFISGPETLTTAQMSLLSRWGSGSSCRSFYSPWALWEGTHAQEFQAPAAFTDLVHICVVVGSQKKEVSSSQAHSLVTSSLLFQNRVTRVRQRMTELIKAIQDQNWPAMYMLCWQEFWDMHSLFETSRPPFGYINAHSLKVLRQIQAIWKKHNDGPVVTMDAGPNVHLLLRSDQKDMAWQIIDQWRKEYRILHSLTPKGRY